DRRIAEAAVAHLKEQAFDFTFVYFGWPDECAHRFAWMSPEYIDAIENADACLGHILAYHPACDELTVLFVSDHGGYDRTHGTDRDEDILVPWVLSGAGVMPGELTEPVSLLDVPPTLAHALGIAPAPQW